MILTDKETIAIKGLQAQEQTCVEKYTRYSKEAHDTELRNLFDTIAKDEQKHHDSLSQVLHGKVPPCNCNDTKGKEYTPTACYKANCNSSEKKEDCFLVTDCIGTEKMVSSEYNRDVFVFGNSDIRKLLADIEIEEQNHAEMLWKYKTVNGMTE